jgi:hypothetical protein
MTVTIEDAEFERAVKELAEVTGEPEDVLLKVAVTERLERVTHQRGRELLDRIRPILDRVSDMPELDPRPSDEILGYNDFGCFD